MAKLNSQSVDKFGANNFRGMTGRNFGKAKNPNDAMTFSVPNYTSDERDSLPNAINGLIIYNETTNKFQGRENGAWVNLI